LVISSVKLGLSAGSGIYGAAQMSPNYVRILDDDPEIRMLVEFTSRAGLRRRPRPQ
jgi:hypothetical protein